MKRTQSINLSRLRKSSLFRLNTVTIAILAASISGCGSKKGVLYSSVEDCIQKNPGDSYKCEQQYQQARSIAHQNLSPFSQKEPCEERYGAQECEKTSRGYFPRISGFLSSNRYGASPLLKDKYSSNFMSLDGTNYGSTPGKVQIQQQTVSRGGFGASAARSSSRGWSFGG